MRSGLKRMVVASCAVSMFCLASVVEAGSYQSKRGWILSASQAIRWIKEGALVLDARPKKQWARGHIKGARPVSWLDFSPDKRALRGNLLKNSALLSSRLHRLGIRGDQKIVVVGDSLHGWGEEGRIVWMLRSLGHTAVAFVDGGLRALRSAGLSVTQQPPPKVSAGSFRLRRSARWSISRQMLSAIVRHQSKHSKGWLLLDTRERREYLGATPYGEQRGGHLPHALHIHFKELMDKSGFLRPRRTLLQTLKHKGLSRQRRIVAYCTGGVRSAWVVVVLYDLGFRRVYNYAGSMWEWSSFPSRTYPLIKKEQKRPF